MFGKRGFGLTYAVPGSPCVFVEQHQSRAVERRAGRMPPSAERSRRRVGGCDVGYFGMTIAQEGGPVEGVTYIVDPADPRVNDYRELNSIAVRAEMEGAEFFMGEGYVPIERMLDSGHRMRSVLLHPKRLKRFIPTMARPEPSAATMLSEDSPPATQVLLPSTVTSFPTSASMAVLLID